MLSPAAIARVCLRSLAREGVPVELRWTSTVSGTLDPTTGYLVGSVTIEHSGTIEPALVHFVSPASTALKLFEDVEVGDLVLDFRPDVALEGKEGLRFHLPTGEVYVPARTGMRTARHFDVVAGPGAHTTFRTVLACKAT